MKEYWVTKLIAVADLIFGASLFGYEFGANVGFGIFFVGAGFYLIILTRKDD